MQRRVKGGLALMGALALALGGAGTAQAAVTCAGPPPLVLFEFEPGSAVVSDEAVAARLREIRAAVGNSELLSYHVLAMGDIEEGAAWEQASVAERLSDQALARERGAAVTRMLRRLPGALRARTSGRLVPNRVTRIGETWLSERTSVAVEIGMHHRNAMGIYVAC